MKYVFLESDFICFTLLSIMLCFCKRSKKAERNGRIFNSLCIAASVGVLSNGISFLLRESQCASFTKLNEIAMFIYYLSVLCICFLYFWYMFVGESEIIAIKKSYYLLTVPAFMSLIVMGCNYLFIKTNNRNAYYWCFVLCCLFYAVAAFLVSMIRLITLRTEVERRKNIFFIIYALLFFVEAIIQLKWNVEAIFLPIFSLSILLLYFMEQSWKEIERNQEMGNMKYETGNVHNPFIMNQIQPHFLFNALNTVCYLCDKDSNAAKKVIYDFSTYLRGSIDSFSRQTPIPFKTELEYLQSYMRIEKYRFPYISIEYAIENSEFQIPSMTLQPIVHNAVKHGLYEKQGGLIVIHTFLSDGINYITITDDGIGFDITKPLDATIPHTGISTVRSKLHCMCHGKLSIESSKGHGTIVTIEIPKC